MADEYASPGSPKFVAGSIGPGTKFPTLGQISYDDLSASYEELAYALLEGGVEVVATRCVETRMWFIEQPETSASSHEAMTAGCQTVASSCT